MRNKVYILEGSKDFYCTERVKNPDDLSDKGSVISDLSVLENILNHATKLNIKDEVFILVSKNVKESENCCYKPVRAKMSLINVKRLYKSIKGYEFASKIAHTISDEIVKHYKQDSINGNHGSTV